MVQEIKKGIIGFNVEGNLLLFESKEDINKYDRKKLAMLFGSPNLMFEHILERREGE